ncbi:MAG: hypothetical protein ACYSSO_09515 [Planctomycetota bacterium]|jgi:hypothetical protein
MRVVYGIVVETSGLSNKVPDEISAGKQDGRDKNDTLVEVVGFWPLKELTI